MHRVKVRVVEDALDASNTIARANRADFDARGVTVVNLMSAPGTQARIASRTSSRVHGGAMAPRMAGLAGGAGIALAVAEGRRDAAAAADALDE